MRSFNERISAGKGRQFSAARQINRAAGRIDGEVVQPSRDECRYTTFGSRSAQERMRRASGSQR
jgi:hypothetical protein